MKQKTGMNIKLMRSIDYWVGIPICFVLSVFNMIYSKVRRRSKRAGKIKKILFLEFSEIGSVILSWPAMNKIKDQYPDSELYFWIFKANQEVLPLLNMIPTDNIITMRHRNFLALIVDIIRNLVKIWKEKIDVVIDMELFSRFSSILTYLTGSPIRVGFYNYCQEGLYRGDLHTHKVSYNPYNHISVNFLSLAYALSSSLDNIPLVKENLDTANINLTIPKNLPVLFASIL